MDQVEWIVRPSILLMVVGSSSLSEASVTRLSSFLEKSSCIFLVFFNTDFMVIGNEVDLYCRSNLEFLEFRHIIRFSCVPSVFFGSSRDFTR